MNENIWRLQLKTGNGIRIAKYCIENNIAAMGWCYAKDSNRKTVISWDEYKNLVKSHNHKVNDSVKRFHNELKPGDLIWIRDNGIYWLGRVTENSKWIFNSSEEATNKDASNQFTNIDWVRCGSESDVPGVVTTSFIKGSTFQRIRKSGISYLTKKIYNSKKNEEIYPVETKKLEKGAFFSLLQPSDLEDILCMWLFVTKGYLVIPSTNKLSTPNYECVLTDPATGKNVYIQVKKGNVSLYKKNYEELIENTDEVYLLTTEGCVSENSDNKNIYTVNPEEIYQFAIDEKNRNYLSKQLRQLITFMEMN